MEAPLLEGCSGEVDLIGENGDYVAVKGVKSWWRVFCIESARLWRIGGPIAFQVLCQYANSSVTTIFVGHLGDIQLSAFSIALSVVYTFSFGFLLGMGSALETLCGQAFGAGEVEMLGVYLQRSIIIHLATCVVVSPLYIFATPILKLVGQKDEIAGPAGAYTLMILPQLCALAVVFPTSKFLQAQSKVAVLTWIAAITLVAQVVLCWVSVYVLEWGTSGPLIAFDVTGWGMAVAQCVYVVGWCKDSWRGLSWAAFRDIWGFVRLSLASGVMLCLEVWYMMTIIILTGHLDNAVTAVGSLSICMNIDSWETMLFTGVNAAISVRVSNELGMGHPRAARYSVYTTILQSVAIGIVCMSVILGTRNYFSFIFSDSEEMRRAVAHLSGLLGITMLLNSVQQVISGVAIGGGWQALVAYINLACYYVFGLPLGYLLGYVANLGVLGLWGGMIAGVGLQTLLLLLVLYRTNWNKEVEETTERMRKWGGGQQDIDQFPK
ncbi:MATE efflux family protein [Perilla frutescens var. hirtella]|uniref:Protein DETOXIFICATION n=1 Tax=Perilla frutescens var. hirtella TaxID=608512 RepID=A0AAD4PCA5_PERFH|nr:MATE efflux family protein [Perilla frutescens var. hirtella]KAH6835074.1 MATE efflux family protein [Perilla frutescens var. hirtella]